MRKLIVFVLTLSVAAASLRVIRSTHAALERRIKRQTPLTGGRGTAAQGAAECLNTCQPLLEAMGEIEGSNLSSAGGLESFLNEEREFNPDDLPMMCDKFKAAKYCFDKCEPNPMIAVITGAFRPLEYMCIEKYDEFVKYQECMHQSALEEDDTCEEKCGDEKEILKAMEGFTELEGQRDFTQIITGLQKVCIFTDCHLTCSAPKIVKDCGSEEPLHLMRNLMGESMGMMNNMFRQFGIGDSMPKECLAITEVKTSTAALEKSSEENSVEDTATTTQRSNDTRDRTTKAPSTHSTNHLDAPQSDARTDGNAAPTRVPSAILFLATLIVARF